MTLLIEEQDGMVVFAKLLENDLVEDVIKAINGRVKHRLRNPVEGVERVEVYAATVDPTRGTSRKWGSGQSVIEVPNGSHKEEVGSAHVR